MEWDIHRKTQLDTADSNVSESDFASKTGLKPEDLRGKLVLDAGCGMGRFADIAQKWGAEVVAVDLSYAVESAYANLGSRQGVHIVQADIMNLPFEAETFDLVYSIGVLHHTPDCKRAFLSLVPLLKKGGSICIWVYSNYSKLHSLCSDLLRKVTVRIPGKILYCMCFASAPLYYIYKIPVLGHLLRNLVPISMQKRWNWRVLDTFDWYSPKYQSKHRYPEVVRWFREAGLSDMELYEPPVAVRGTKRPSE
jgi:SAM-dependent methyltransferase